MKKMIVVVALLVMGGCAAPQPTLLIQHKELKPVMVPPLNSYKPRYTHKSLSDYAEQMTMELMSKAKFIGLLDTGLLCYRHGCDTSHGHYSQH